MEPTPQAGEDAHALQLEGELRLVREAILMVAANASPRVLVAGLCFGDRIAEPCARMAAEAGVRLVAVRAVGSGRLGFSVERELTPAPRPVTDWAATPALESGG